MMLRPLFEPIFERIVKSPALVRSKGVSH
jgi:hypothetical protein